MEIQERNVPKQARSVHRLALQDKTSYISSEPTMRRTQVADAAAAEAAHGYGMFRTRRGPPRARGTPIHYHFLCLFATRFYSKVSRTSLIYCSLSSKILRTFFKNFCSSSCQALGQASRLYIGIRALVRAYPKLPPRLPQVDLGPTSKGGIGGPFRAWGQGVCYEASCSPPCADTWRGARGR